MQTNPEILPREVSPGVWAITTPFSQLSGNLLYLIVDEVITLVDSGHGNDGVIRVLKENLSYLGYTLSDIDQIIYTHHHSDHFGGGVLISREVSCRHLINDGIVDELKDVDAMFRPMRYLPDTLCSYYPSLQPYLAAQPYHDYFLKEFPLLGHFDAKVEGLEDGQIIDLGKRKLQVFCTPGHSPHDIVLIDYENGLLFSGDFLMVVGPGFAFTDGGDVGDFLQSLEKLEKMNLDIKLMLPAAGEFSNDILAVINNSRGIILHRNKKILRFLESGPKPIIEIFDYIFPSLRARDDFAAFMSLFLTHLRYLEREGQVIELDKSGVFSLSK